MRLRKLRIVWSVAWGVAAILLVVLWVRGYWRYQRVYFQVTVGKHDHILVFRSYGSRLRTQYVNEWTKAPHPERFFTIRKTRRLNRGSNRSERIRRGSSLLVSAINGSIAVSIRSFRTGLQLVLVLHSPPFPGFVGASAFAHCSSRQRSLLYHWGQSFGRRSSCVIMGAWHLNGP